MSNVLHDDDAPIGRILTRREAIALLGGAGTLLPLAACVSSSGGPAVKDTPSLATATCVVKPQLTEGPYFVDEKLNRADIRSDTASQAVKGTFVLDVSAGITHFPQALKPVVGLGSYSLSAISGSPNCRR